MDSEELSLPVYFSLEEECKEIIISVLFTFDQMMPWNIFLDIFVDIL